KLTVIGLCCSEGTAGGKTSDQLRLFSGSQHASARVYGEALRGHWGIENGQSDDGGAIGLPPAGSYTTRISFAGLVGLAQLPRHAAQPVQTGAQVALGLGVLRVGLGQASRQLMSFLVLFACGLRVAKQQFHVSQSEERPHQGAIGVPLSFRLA